MAARRTTFGKLDRDRAKKAKAAAKRERRVGRSTDTPEGAAEDSPIEAPIEALPIPQEEVLDQLATLHERFDQGDIGFDDFEQQKATLLASLAVE